MDSLKSRIKKLNNSEPKIGDSVIYIMSRDQRVRDNHALIAAYKHAESKNLPLVVAFILYPKVKNRTKNIYLWMIEGLKKVESDLEDLNIPFIVKVGESIDNFNELVQEFNPERIYFDFSPLRGPRISKQKFADSVDIPCYVVDTHNIVPVWIASDKHDTAARTIRPKIFKKLEEYLVEPEQLSTINYELSNKIQTKIDWDSQIEMIDAEFIDDYAPSVKSGEDEALKLLSDFIDNKLEGYSEDRNEPVLDEASNLSAYLHFGQISSLRVLLEISKKLKIDISEITEHELTKSFVNEVVVWKELSDNYCYYEKDYDNLNAASKWAIDSLRFHENDKREYIYTLEELEEAKTHDPAWNASQIQMMKTGKMHGYMRMYWAKKILEWSENAETAIKYAIYLNDKYELDGYDPNGYSGIMWAIAGVHDHGWTEREIFGKIRYMNYAGLKRKFRIEEYIEKLG